jgi:hypothetical protein
MPDSDEGSSKVFSLIVDAVIAKVRVANIRDTIEGPYAKAGTSLALREQYMARLSSAETEASQLENLLRTAATPDEWAMYEHELRQRLARFEPSIT